DARTPARPVDGALVLERTAPELPISPRVVYPQTRAERAHIIRARSPPWTPLERDETAAADPVRITGDPGCLGRQIRGRAFGDTPTASFCAARAAHITRSERALGATRIDE